MGYRIKRTTRKKNRLINRNVMLFILTALMFVVPANSFSISSGLTQTATVAADNTSTTSYYLGSNTIQRGNIISINVNDTDIRDLLSAIAINMGTNIVYIEDPSKITLKVDSLTPKQAFQVVLTKMGLSFIQSGNDIIVGKSENLENSLFKNVILTKITLKYLEAANIITEIEKLGLSLKFFGTANNTKVLVVQGTIADIGVAKSIINYLDTKDSGNSSVSLIPKRLSYVTSDKIVTMASDLALTGKIITIDTNKYILWVKGTVAEVQAITDLIKKVDIASNKNLAGKVLKINLDYVTAAKVAEIIDKMGIDVNIIDSGTDTKALWVIGTTTALNEVKSVVKQVDVIDNYSYLSGTLSAINLTYITSNEVAELASSLALQAKLVYTTFNPKTIWAMGDSGALDEIRAVIATIDVAKNNNDINAFVYACTNITAEEAKIRLDLFQYDKVTTTMVRTKFAKDLIVFCPTSMTQKVRDSLESIDVLPEKITVPIDSSAVANGNVGLAARRDLLVSLIGIPSSAYSISGNVSRDPIEFYYVLYVTETPDNIQKVVNMVKAIDDPLSDNE